MEGSSRLIWTIVGVVVFAVGLYFLFQGNYVFDIIFPNDALGTAAKQAAIGARDRVYQVVDPIVRPVLDSGQNLINGLYSKVRGSLVDTLSETKNEAVQSVKNTVNQKIDEVAAGIGFGQASGGGSGTSGNPHVGGGDKNEGAFLIGEMPLGFSVALGKPAIFIIKNPKDFKGSAEYNLDWGDGQKESAALKDSEAKTVYHVWNAKRDYVLKISFVNGQETKQFSVTIVVY